MRFVCVRATSDSETPCFYGHLATIGRMDCGDWFEGLMGFREGDYELTQRRLLVEGDELVSAVNHRRYGIGSLTMPTLDDLRGRVKTAGHERSTVRCLVGDARKLHSDPEFEGGLFQVASQFNLLEMIHQRIRPEDGVARYADDPTQGPACAIAAGAATIYRNYCVPIRGEIGQKGDRQLDTLAGVGAALSEELGQSVSQLWTMRNGYALCTADGLDEISKFLGDANDDRRRSIQGQLAIGVHRDVEITDLHGPARQSVSQAFCSALPVAYTSIPQNSWEAFARFVLEASYEATLLMAAELAAAAASNQVLLTRVGGGAFGNADAWIDDAIGRALLAVEYAGLDVRLVSRGSVHPSMRSIADSWNSGIGFPRPDLPRDL
jgi:hypothetical protein